jgi:hypothetical protein
MMRGALTLCLVAGLWSASTGPLRAPTSEAAQDASGSDTLRAWTFPVGERMEYSVTWGRVRLGGGSLTIEAIDTIGPHPGYRIALEMSGGPPFYRVNDRQITWIRPEPLGSLRFEQSLREGGYKRDTRYVFDVDELEYSRFDIKDGDWRLRDEETAVPIPEGALDDLAYLYFARLLPLEVGQRYEFDRYFKESGNPVVIEVLRKEEIRVPAGTFRTVVLRPIIQTGGVFGDGGEAELYVTDDDRRAIVRLKTSMAVGSGNMFLTHYEAGEGALIPAAEPETASSHEPDSGSGGS